MKAKRVNEMLATMKSFSKEKYQKKELLTEMFALQDDIVKLTFNDEHAATADLKIWDVERHLEQLNRDCGNVADEELQKFKNGSKTLCNLIKAEISGNRGERKAFNALHYLHSANVILKNVELKDDNSKTELDAIVITPHAITIVEVKNTSRNVFIDENGDYYRTGEYLRWDSNIARKMKIREELLWNLLKDKGIEDVNINSIVLFTNNRIEIHNKYSGIRTCFLSQLTHIIESLENAKGMPVNDMEEIEGVIRNAACEESYSFDFDVNEYKQDFATVMAILEEASAKIEKEECEEEVIPKMKNGIVEGLKAIGSSKYVRLIGNAFAEAAVTAVYSVAMGAIKKGGSVR